MSIFEGPLEETRKQVKYNVYAFGVQVRRFTSKRDKARKEHTRARWQKRLDFAMSCLNDNKKYLIELGEAEQSLHPTPESGGTKPAATSK